MRRFEIPLAIMDSNYIQSSLSVVFNLRGHLRGNLRANINT